MVVNASLKVDRSIEAGAGDSAAYVTHDESLSYEQLRQQVNRMGHLLRGLGVRREERVLLVLDNTPVFPVAFLGALRIGAVPVPVSFLDTEDNFRHFIEDSYAEVVVCDPGVLPKVQHALTGRDLRYLARGGGEGATDLDAALADQADELEVVATHADDMACWLYTSGSTGKPKGVVHRHGSIEYTCETFARHVLRVQAGDRVFSTSKLYHAFGLGNLLSFPLHVGATSILLDHPPAPERLLAVLREHRPTVYLSVPPLYRQLVGDLDADGAFDSVRLCITSAEPVPARTVDEWRNRFGLELIECIGSTEMLHVYCSNEVDAPVAGTTGRPVPGYELRLVDETGSVLVGPAVGMMQVRGKSCAAFYWHQSEKSRRTIRGEWFVTGDRFERSESGDYTYVGRADDMLRIGGQWVSPANIEQVLLGHDAVAAVGVVGVSVDDYTRLAAFVKCSAGAHADEALREELRAWCRDRMRDYEFPHLIRFVDDLPQTLTGKPQRFRLREMIEAELNPAGAEDARQRAELGAKGSPVPGLTPPPPPGMPAAGAAARGRSATAVATRPEPYLARELAGLPEGDRERAVLTAVLREMSEVMAEPSPETIPVDRSFKELGFDSLAAVELRNRLGNAGGVRLPSTLVFDHPTPVAVAALLRSRIEQANSGEAADQIEEREELDGALRPTPPPPMPAAAPALRIKTSAAVRVAVPHTMAVARAARRAEALWEESDGEREHARAATEIIVAGTAREREVEELARARFVERMVDRALFWDRPWSLELEPSTEETLRRAFSNGRGVVLSACHLGPYYRLQSTPLLRGEDTYLVPGGWFFEQPSRGYWGRRLARWRRGTTRRLVPADGSFAIVQALLERGDHAFVFFDMPGPRETRFLGKPTTLANGTAHLAVLADALVVPLRARRAGSRVLADADAPRDPRDFADADQLHDELAAIHERWILENPAAMDDPRDFGWQDGATTTAWRAPTPAAP